MDRIRKPLSALCVVLGAYYVALGAFVLTRLPTITREWVSRSGDPVFRLDYSSFTFFTSIGASSIGLCLGYIALWLLNRRPIGGILHVHEYAPPVSD